jgi:putative DNA primase/helicase
MTRPVRVSAIEMRPVEFLWEPFVPLGKLTDIAGQMGQGKSLLTELLAAGVTTAHGVDLQEPASVLMFAAEDDSADTIRPRLEAAGADTDRVYIVTGDALDATLIDSYCEEIGDVRLVTVDPLTGFFPKGVDAWNTPQVRRFLRPHIDLAQRRRFALLGVRHINRRADSDPLARIADAQGIPQVARSVLVWGPDPDDPDGDGGDRKVLATAKNNLIKGRPAASFRIETVCLSETITAPRLVYLGESSAEAGDLVADQEARSQTQDAVRWLRDLLADGPVPVEEAKKAAADIGITPKPLRSARERIATHSRPGGNHGPYVWTLKPACRDNRATTGIHSNSKGIQEGNHDTGQGIQESVDALDGPCLPVDARECPDAHDPDGDQHARLTAKFPELAL